MERRQDKYEPENSKKKMTRTQKHQNLYNEINSKIGFSDISSYESGTKIDLSNLNFDNLQREEYQKVKEYKNIINNEPVKEEEEKQKTKAIEKNFDINAVLEEAKKNRKEEDELEKKRNLSGDESVLSSLNKKYLHTKDFDEEEKELLSELLATTIDIKLEQELSNEEINKLYEDSDDEDNSSDSTDEYEITDELDGNTNLADLENSFFTHSVELKKEDLIDDEKYESDDAEEEEDNDKKGVIKITLVIIVLLALVLFITFFILKQIGF